MAEKKAKGITAEMFARLPAVAKQMLAIRIMNLIFPPQVTRNLPGKFKAMFGPGGAALPPGEPGPGIISPETPGPIETIISPGEPGTGIISPEAQRAIETINALSGGQLPQDINWQQLSAYAIHFIAYGMAHGVIDPQDITQEMLDWVNSALAPPVTPPGVAETGAPAPGQIAIYGPGPVGAGTPLESEPEEPGGLEWFDRTDDTWWRVTGGTINWTGSAWNVPDIIAGGTLRAIPDWGWYYPFIAWQIRITYTGPTLTMKLLDIGSVVILEKQEITSGIAYTMTETGDSDIRYLMISPADDENDRNITKIEFYGEPIIEL